MAAVYIHGRILCFYYNFQRIGLWFLDKLNKNLGSMKHVYCGLKQTLVFFQNSCLSIENNGIKVLKKQLNNIGSCPNIMPYEKNIFMDPSLESVWVNEK